MAKCEAIFSNQLHEKTLPFNGKICSGLEQFYSYAGTKQKHFIMKKVKTAKNNEDKRGSTHITGTNVLLHYEAR